MNALQSSFQLISPALFMGPNDACRHRSRQKMRRKNEVTGVAVVPDAERNLLFLFSLHSHCTHDATVAQGQPRGNQEAGRRRGNQKWSKQLERCISFIAISEKDAYTILQASNPVHEPAMPSRTVLTFSADHHFVALFALWNPVF
jgi:hypothetical protein